MSQVIAGVFLDGRPVEAVSPLLGLLVVAAVVRAAGLWLLEVLAQRAGGRLQGRLREDLVDRTFRLGPAWVAERRAGDLASVLTAGLDAIGAWMALYQPARLLAGSVPLLVLLVVVLIDPLSSLVLIFTGPVLLLLLAVIGSRTQAISDRRFAELRWLSAFFVELLHGLPTLRAFGRSREQADTLREISDRLRVSTMDVLRSAFQTGLVLDWGGAVAMALVAVQIGLRLMADAIPFDRALAVLFITPEFFLPLRQLAVRYHAGSAGRTAATEVFAILDEAVPGEAAGRPSPVRVDAPPLPVPAGPAGDPVRWRRRALPGSRHRRPRRADARHARGRPGRHRRGDRCRQDDAGAAPHAVRRARCGIDPRRRDAARGARPGRVARPGRLGPAGAAPVPRHDRRQPPDRAAGRDGRPAARRARGRRGRSTSSTSCPRASTPPSARAACA